MASPTRWVTDTGPNHSQRYIARFRELAAAGADLAGEARLLDAMLVPGSHVLDAGCGTGRVGAAIQARGHSVVGVDADPEMIAAARADHPKPVWLTGDLAELDLVGAGRTEPFDAAVVAGNVMPFLAPGTARVVLARLAAHLRPDGFIAVGFGLGRGYSLTEFDVDLAMAGLDLEHRFATWDLRPWQPDSDFAVSVLRRPKADDGQVRAERSLAGAAEDSLCPARSTQCC